MLSPELLRKERQDQLRETARVEARRLQGRPAQEETSPSGGEEGANEEFNPEDEICF